jgi:hypothetical protein
MTKRVLGHLVAALAATSILSGVAWAQSRVGVTSATSGGPLGKPPAEAERVLHVGVDVQANEAVRTGPADRAHLVFLDGSSLTVGPQARVTIDRFVYDPKAKAAALDMHAAQGVFRFVGGKISKMAPVTIATPSAAITIRGGIALVSVEPAKTIATFVFGVEMTVTAGGQTRTVTRPGWQVVTLAGQAPGPVVQAPPGSLTGELGQLEATRSQPGSENVDKQVDSSGLARQNSKLGISSGGGTGQGAGEVSNALSGSNIQQQKPILTPAPAPPMTSGQTGGGR